MVSILEPIRAKMVEHLKALSALGNVKIDYTDKETQYPFAVLTFGTGEFISDINNTLDMSVDVYIALHGQGRDNIDELAESIQKLWYNSTNFTALSALGVISINPTGRDTPGEFNTQKDVMSIIVFEMEVRYNYL